MTLTGAIAPDNGTQANQPKPAPNAERTLDAIASAQNTLVKNSEPGEYQKPCADGTYDNKSDLCAQWYAARAARDSADWAYWAVFWTVISLGLSAVGLLALCVTIRQGQRGLERAREANEIARESQERQLRAYIAFDGLDEPKPATPGLYQPLFKNVGATPARNVRFAHAIKGFENGIPADFDFKVVVKMLPGGSVGAGMPAIGAGEKISLAEAKELALKPSARFLLWGAVEYDDVFADTPTRRTEWAVEIYAEPGTGDGVVVFRRTLLVRMDEDCPCAPVPTQTKEGAA